MRTPISNDLLVGIDVGVGIQHQREGVQRGSKRAACGGVCVGADAVPELVVVVVRLQGVVLGRKLRIPRDGYAVAQESAHHLQAGGWANKLSGNLCVAHPDGPGASHQVYPSYTDVGGPYPARGPGIVRARRGGDVGPVHAIGAALEDVVFGPLGHRPPNVQDRVIGAIQGDVDSEVLHDRRGIVPRQCRDLDRDGRKAAVRVMDALVLIDQAYCVASRGCRHNTNDPTEQAVLVLRAMQQMGPLLGTVHVRGEARGGMTEHIAHLSTHLHGKRAILLPVRLPEQHLVRPCAPLKGLRASIVIPRLRVPGRSCYIASQVPWCALHPKYWDLVVNRVKDTSLLSREPEANVDVYCGCACRGRIHNRPQAHPRPIY